MAERAVGVWRAPAWWVTEVVSVDLGGAGPGDAVRGGWSRFPLSMSGLVSIAPC